MKLLRKVSVSAQIALLCASFVIPLVVVIVVLVGKYNEQLDFTVAEINGVSVITPLRQAAVADLKGQPVAVPVTLAAVADRQNAAAATYLDAVALKELEEGLRSPDPAARLGALATAVLRVSDASNLTLDPEVPTFYAMDVSVTVLLSMGRNTVAIQQAVSALHQENTEANRLRLAMAQGALLADAARLETALKNGRTADSAPIYDQRLGPALQPVQHQGAALIQRLSVSGGGIGGAVADASLSGAAQGLLLAVASGWQVAEQELDGMLKARRDAILSEYRQTVGACVGLAMLALGIAVLIARGVSGFLRQLQVWMRQIAAGERAALEGWTGDGSETGRAVQTVEKLDTEVQQAFVLKQMVEDMTANVMTCDARTLAITYVNRAGRAMLETVAAHLGCPPSAVIGRDIGVLHPFEATERAAFGQAEALPLARRVHIGDEVFQVRVSPVRNSRGEYVQAMLTWVVITQQVRLADRFEASVKKIVDTVADGIGVVDSGSHRLSETAERASSRSAAALETTNEVNAAVQTAAAAVEELSASIHEISSRVTQAAQVASDATHEAGHTVVVMRSMEQAAHRISEVAALISTIADQTNLLALNATIEAARAGEAGKGFAVVANEVKNLATQTGLATSEITTQIMAMQHAAQESVKAIAHISGIIGTMDMMTSDIAAAVEQQNAATHEISRNMAGVARGSQETARHVDELRVSAETTSGEATSLRHVSETLTQQAHSLSQEVDAFLASVRVY